MTGLDSVLQARILLVDDEDFIRRVIRQVLTSLGFTHIVEEGDGLQAVQRLQAVQYDLILTDVQMPNLNGLDLLKRIRCGRTAAPRDSRLLVITSFANTEVLGSAMALDVNGFLVKPIKPASVEAKIRTALQERFQVRAADQYAHVPTHLNSIQQDRPPETPAPATANAGIVRGVADVRKEIPAGASQVSISNLRPGMTLCEDLRLPDGMLILSAKHLLSENGVNRLLDLSSLLPNKLVWVLMPDSDGRGLA